MQDGGQWPPQTRRITNYWSGSGGCLAGGAKGPALDLVTLDRLEQRLEVAFAETVVTLALDEFEEHRTQLRHAEDLHQQARLAVRDRAIEQQAAQCGYCLNGMVMMATALLARNPDPDEADVRRELSSNLCRCGTHVEIVRAVLTAARRARA